MKTDHDEFNAEELTLIELAREYSDNDKARALLESLRWPNGPVCPHCKNDGKDKAVYQLTPKAGSTTRKGLYKCGACRKQFTVTVGTIFEDSHIPISTWLQALFIMCSSKKAISSHQIHRMLGVTYKTAWFLTHRIRYAMELCWPERNKNRLTGEKRSRTVATWQKTSPQTRLNLCLRRLFL